MAAAVGIDSEITVQTISTSRRWSYLLHNVERQHCTALQECTRTKRFEAVIDSGASRCIFHASIGRFIGLEIEKGMVEETLGINGVSRNYLHDIVLFAPGGIINVRAGFSEDLPIAGLLGMNGFFDHFKVTFDPTAQQCEIERIFLA